MSGRRVIENAQVHRVNMPLVRRSPPPSGRTLHAPRKRPLNFGHDSAAPPNRRHPRAATARASPPGRRSPAPGLRSWSTWCHRGYHAEGALPRRHVALDGPAEHVHSHFGLRVHGSCARCGADPSARWRLSQSKSATARSVQRQVTAGRRSHRRVRVRQFARSSDRVQAASPTPCRR